MEMFLILAFVSVFVGGVSALLLVAAERAQAPMQRPEAPRPMVEPTHFFLSEPTRRATRTPAIPIDLLVSQIDGHVRLEHAAMEAFLQNPDVQALHSRTTSTLVH